MSEVLTLSEIFNDVQDERDATLESQQTGVPVVPKTELEDVPVPANDLAAGDPADPWVDVPVPVSGPGVMPDLQQEEVAPGDTEEMNSILHGIANAADTTVNLAGGLAYIVDNATRGLAESLEDVAGFGAITWDEDGLGYDSPEEWEARKAERGEEARALATFSKALMAVDWAEAEDTWEDVKSAEGVLDTTKQAILYAGEEFVPSLIHMAGAVLAGPVYVTARGGQLTSELVENDGRKTATALDMARGMATAATSFAIDRLGGFDNLIKIAGGKAGFWSKALSGGAVESSTEGVQELIEYLGTTLGTKAGATVGEGIDRILAGMVGGGLPGAAIAGGKHLLDRDKGEGTPDDTDTEGDNTPPPEGDIDVGDDGEYSINVPSDPIEAADFVRAVMEENDAEINNAVIAAVQEKFGKGGNSKMGDQILNQARDAKSRTDKAPDVVKKLEEREAKAKERVAKAKAKKNKATDPDAPLPTWEEQQAIEAKAKGEKPAPELKAGPTGVAVEEDVTGQVTALEEGRRTAILVPEGHENEPAWEGVHKSDYNRVKVSKAKAKSLGDEQLAGTYYVKDAKLIRKIREATSKAVLNQLLSQPAEGKAPNADTAVVAKDADGNVVLETAVESGTDGEAAAIEVADGAAGKDGTVETLPADEALEASRVSSEETEGEIEKANMSAADRVATHAGNDSMFVTEKDNGVWTKGKKKGQKKKPTRIGKDVLGGNVSVLHQGVMDDGLLDAEADGYDVSKITKLISKVHNVKNLAGKAKAAGLTQLAYLNKFYVQKGKLDEAGQKRSSSQAQLVKHLADMREALLELGTQPEPEGLAEKRAAADAAKSEAKATADAETEAKKFYPAARKMASEAGINSADITSSGKKITVGEVRAAIKAKEPAPDAKPEKKKKAVKKKAVKKKAPVPKVDRSDRQRFHDDASFDMAVEAGLTARDIGIQPGRKITQPQVRRAVKDGITGTRTDTANAKKVNADEKERAGEKAKKQSKRRESDRKQAEAEQAKITAHDKVAKGKEVKALIKKVLNGKDIRVGPFLKALGMPGALYDRAIDSIKVVNHYAAYVINGEQLPESTPDAHRELYQRLYAVHHGGVATKTAENTSSKVEKQHKPAETAPKETESAPKEEKPKQKAAKKVAKKRTRSPKNVEHISERDNATAFNARIKALYKLLTGSKKLDVAKMQEAAGPTGYSLDASEFLTVLARITEGNRSTEGMTQPQIDAMTVLAEKVEALLDNTTAITSLADRIKGDALGRGRTSTAAHISDQIKTATQNILDAIGSSAIAQVALEAVKNPAAQVDLERTLDAHGVDNEIAEELLQLVSTANAISQVDSKVAYEDTFEARQERADNLDVAEAQRVAEAEAPTGVTTETEQRKINEKTGEFEEDAGAADRFTAAEEQFFNNTNDPATLEWYNGLDAEAKQEFLNVNEDQNMLEEELGLSSIDTYDENDPDFVQAGWEDLRIDRGIPGLDKLPRRIQNAILKRRAHVVSHLFPKFLAGEGKTRTMAQVIRGLNSMLHKDDPLIILGQAIITDPDIARQPVTFNSTEYGVEIAKHMGRDSIYAQEQQWESDKNSMDNKFAGWYAAGKWLGGVINLSRKYMNDVSTTPNPDMALDGIETIYHEALHAVTIKELQNSPEFLRDIVSQMREVAAIVAKMEKNDKKFTRWLDQYRGSYDYMMSDPAEFITKGMTNPFMSQLLADVKLEKPARMPDGSVIRNMYEKFMYSIKTMLDKALGIKVTPYSALTHLASSISEHQLSPAERQAMFKVKQWMQTAPGEYPSDVPGSAIDSKAYYYKYDPDTQTLALFGPTGGVSEAVFSHRLNLKVAQLLIADPTLTIGEAVVQGFDGDAIAEQQADNAAFDVQEWYDDQNDGDVQELLLNIRGNISGEGQGKVELRGETTESGSNKASRRKTHNKTRKAAGSKVADAVDTLDDVNTGSLRGAANWAKSKGRWARKHVLGLAMLDQIQTQYNEKIKWFDTKSGTWVKPVENVVTAMRKRFAEAKEYHKQHEHLMRLWDALTPEQEQRLNETMLDATMHEVDPSKTWAGQDASVKTKGKDGKLDRAGKRRKKAHTKLRKDWTKLSQTERNIFNKSRDYFASSLEARRVAAITSMINEFGVDARYVKIFKNLRNKSAISNLQLPQDADGDPLYKDWGKAVKSLNEINDIMRVTGPYFPTMRFGNHAVHFVQEQVSKTFATKEEADAFADDWKGGSWDRRTTITKTQLGDFKVDGIQETFDLFENEADAFAMQDELKKDGITATVTDKAKLPNLSQASAQILGAAQAKASTAEAQQQIYQAFLHMLPEGNVGKHLMRRKKVGLSRGNLDMRRTMASYIESTGWQIGELTHGREVRLANNQMQDARKELTAQGDVKGAELASVVANEMSQRVNMQTESNTDVMMAVGKFGFMWHLASVSYSMINATQPYLITIPWLGGKFGTRAAAREMQRAYSDIGGTVLKSIQKEWGGLKNLSSDHSTSVDTLLERIADNILKSGRPDAKVIAEAIRQLGADGVIDASFTMMLHEASQGGGGRRKGQVGKGVDTLVEVSRVMPFTVEILNRSTTAVAAYRLHAKNNNTTDANGKPDRAAMKFAALAVRSTQFDYSNMNRPRYFIKNDFLRAATMFKIYPVGIYGLLVDSVNLSFAKDKDARREGHKRILLMGITSATLSGGAGIMIEPLRILMGLLSNLWEDDDEMQWILNNPDLFMRQMIIKATLEAGGDKEMAKTLSSSLTYGLPNLLGIDAYSRLGYQSLAMQMQHDQDGSIAWMSSMAEAAMGPIFGKGNTLSLAVDKFNAGQGMSSLKSLMPKAVRDVWNGMDRMQNGITDFSGNQILAPEKLSPVDLFNQVIGFSPTAVSQTYNNRRLVSSKMGGIKAEKTRFRRMFKDAKTQKERTRIWKEEVKPFNAGLPKGAKKLSYGALNRSVNSQKKRERNTIGGVYLNREEKRLFGKQLEVYE